ncbi:MAG: hypothetical protein KJ847_06795 [Firmicutes bacterium]|nr:hypothetical protein [Bacillota bacterium]
MKKGMSFLLAVLVLFLTACSSNSFKLNYEVLDDTVNGYNVVHVTVDESNSVFCKAFSTVIIEVDENTQVTFTYGCMGDGYFLEIDGDYLNFDKAVEFNHISALDAMNSGYGRVIYLDSIVNRVDFNLGDFTITEAVVHEVNGELSLSGSGEWDTSYNLELDLVDIAKYLQHIVAVRIEENDICRSTLCVLLKGQAPIQLDLESSTHILNIQVYEDYVDLFFTIGEDTYYIYHISDDNSNVDQLFDYLYNLHQEVNK